MKGEERRAALIKKLQGEEQAVNGTKLARLFNVSRQVIVQDIAILRAQGVPVMATPSGYILMPPYEQQLIKNIAVRHATYEEMEEELGLVLDYGGKVIDVLIDHPLYGEIRSVLNIRSRKELEVFMENIFEEGVEPLSSLTQGRHFHTIEVPDEEAYKKIKQELAKKGYLMEALD